MNGKIVSFHSYRRGAGKSTLVANVSALLAMDGYRVGVMDLNFLAPSLAILFGLDDAEVTGTLNDFIWGRCELEEIIVDMTGRLAEHGQGRGALFALTASVMPKEIDRVSRGGYYINLISDACHEFIQLMDLDFLIFDTIAGLMDETQLAVAIADAMVMVLRPDQQDYQGTGMMLDVARRLSLPELSLVVNEVPATLDRELVRMEVQDAYECVVTAVLPHSQELALLGSGALFVQQYPDHPLTAEFRKIAFQLMPQA